MAEAFDLVVVGGGFGGCCAALASMTLAASDRKTPGLMFMNP